MNIDEIKSNNGLNLACIISGTVFSIVTVFVFTAIYSTNLLNISEDIKNNFTFLVVNISIAVVAFIIGFFIQGIRYLGFNYYIYIYKKSQPKRLAGKKYPSLYQRLIFYLFRNGTAVEECLDNIKAKYEDSNLRSNKLYKRIINKQYRPNYDWIQQSGNKAPKDMWIYANRINKISPQDNIYKFYYWSEVFQCLDTTFFLFAIIFVLLIITNIMVNIFNEEYILKISLLIIFVIVTLLLHILSKGCSKMYARRFLFDIDNSLKAHKIEYEDAK